MTLVMGRNGAGDWRSVEVFTRLPDAYGHLDVTLAGWVDRHPPEVVVAVFVYRDDTSEFDVEWTRFNRSEWPNGHFTVAPQGRGRQFSFRFRQRAPRVRVQLSWFPEAVAFRLGTLAWTFRGPGIPRPNGHRLHVSIWRIDNLPAHDGRERRVIVEHVAFTPSLPAGPACALSEP